MTISSSWAQAWSGTADAQPTDTGNAGVGVGEGLGVEVGVGVSVGCGVRVGVGVGTGDGSAQLLRIASPTAMPRAGHTLRATRGWVLCLSIGRHLSCGDSRLPRRVMAIQTKEGRAVPAFSWWAIQDLNL